MVVDTILYITDTWRFVFFSNDTSGMWLEGRTRHRGLHCGRCLHLRAPEGACRHSGRACSRPPLCYSAPARLEVFSECVAMGALQCRIKVHLTLLSRFLKGTLTTPNCSVAGTLEPTRCICMHANAAVILILSIRLANVGILRAMARTGCICVWH